MKIYLTSWYVNGKRDIGVVCETTPELAQEVTKVRLEDKGIKIDHKVRVQELKLRPMEFRPLSHMGHV